MITQGLGTIKSGGSVVIVSNFQPYLYLITGNDITKYRSFDWTRKPDF